MNGNFNPMLNLKESKTTVDARGWLLWDDDDVSAKIKVTVTQNGVTGTANVDCKKGDDTWQVDVPAPRGTSFVRGSATGTADATVTTTSNPEPLWWQSPPLQLN